MWSFGCVLYELLKYTIRDPHSDIKDFVDKERILFQGASCFPLSPVNHSKGNGVIVIANKD